MIEDLLRIAPVPPRSAPVAWAELEQRLGCGLPYDYKGVVERFGPGVYGGFIHIFQPMFPQHAVDLESQIVASDWALRELERSGERIPYELTSPSELMAIGRTDNGDILYYVRRPLTNPDNWAVAVNEARGDEWNYFDGGLTDFLAAALSGAARFSVFPSDFPIGAPPFEPYA